MGSSSRNRSNKSDMGESSRSRSSKSIDRVVSSVVSTLFPLLLGGTLVALHYANHPNMAACPVCSPCAITANTGLTAVPADGQASGPELVKMQRQLEETRAACQRTQQQLEEVTAERDKLREASSLLRGQIVGATEGQAQAPALERAIRELEETKAEHQRTQQQLLEMTAERDKLRAVPFGLRHGERAMRRGFNQSQGKFTEEMDERQQCSPCQTMACDSKLLAPCNALSSAVGKLRISQLPMKDAMAEASQAVVDLTFSAMNTTRGDTTAVFRVIERISRLPFLAGGMKRDLERTMGECKRRAGMDSAMAEAPSAEDHTLGSKCRAFGCQCTATEDEISQYLNYATRDTCPDDWLLVQHLIVDHNCHSLPRRRCFGANWTSYQEPLPLPKSLWSPEALMDSNIRWNHHYCKNFTCLMSSGAPLDCPECFLYEKDKAKYFEGKKGMLKFSEALRRALLHNTTLRIGLDLGGGTGTFAALMAENNITIITTGINIDGWTEKGGGGEAHPELAQTRQHTKLGIPYMETIALRGLIPLHVPHTARLPFFDSTLDIIHTAASVDGMDIDDFEDAMFDWDRVLRPGGILWFSAFHSHIYNMSKYMDIVEIFGYKSIFRKGIPSLREDGMHVYFNLLIRKPYERVIQLPDETKPDPMGFK